MQTVSKSKKITISEGDTEPIAFMTEHLFTDDEKIIMTIREVKQITRTGIIYGDIVGQFEGEAVDEIQDCCCSPIGTTVLVSLRNESGVNNIPAGYYNYELAMISDTDEITLIPASTLEIKEKLR